MGRAGSKTDAGSGRGGLGGLSREECLGVYRLMFLSRAIDDAEIRLKRKNLIFFQISGAGHEAVSAAAGLALKGGYDWFLPYYRDRALNLAVGVTPKEMFLSAVGSIEDPASGGRQMPAHWGHERLRIVSQGSPTGSQMLHAAGIAEACLYGEKTPGVPGKFPGDEIVYVSVGDGTTSEGEFWEAMNTICNLALPVLVVVQDNGYAISVPVEVTTAGGDISRLLEGWPNLLIRKVDGCDPVACLEVFREAAARLRARKGPVLVHAKTTRPYAHSMSDDQSAYRLPEEIEEEAKNDPIARFAKRLVGEGSASEKDLASIRSAVLAELEEAEREALESPRPGPDDAERFVYSEKVDPASGAFESEPAASGESESIVGLINRCLHDEMARDPRIVVFGQDVADASREEILSRVKGKGGVFKVTAGLQRAFGSHRVFNAPLAEANIVGRAAGWALRGMKPVVEIQFSDYIWPAFLQIRNEVSMMRWRSRNAFACPLVVRVPVGGYLQGGAAYHSQSGAVLFTHNPGLRVVCPSNARDASGLLRTAIRCDDPVLFLEHKHLYRQPYAKGDYPGPDYTIPFGKGAIVREGSDLTIVTYGALVRRSEMAARALEKDGIRAEVIDLRSLSPWDLGLVGESVKKTSKALVVYEDTRSFGFGAEVAAWIADELFEDLDAPVRRLAALDTPVGYFPGLEDAILPQTEDVIRQARDLYEY
ncbi:MAG: dehydrogenase E1 component subunit alpha/beta [Candidatus Eisenbacteria bacterium]